MRSAPGPFGVLVSDPPWPIGDKLPGPTRGAIRNYDLMSMDQIINFKLPPLLPDCTLFLWRLASMQQEALTVMDEWGFTLKTEIVWLKRTCHGARWFGMGHTVRAEHETCLIGTRGRPLTLSHSIRSTFEAEAGRHSDKPEDFYRIVEQLKAGPYCELFARRRQAGWTCKGVRWGHDR